MRMSEVIDPNEVLLVKNFFLHPVWQRIEDRIKEYIACEDMEINTILMANAPANHDSMNIVNYHAAKRRTYLEVRAIKEEMLEAVDPEYGQEPVEKMGFDVKPVE